MADNFLNSVKKRFAEVTSREVISLEQYLDRCKTDPSAYANVYQRLLTAIGEPVVVDTKNDSRLSRIFNNRVIRRYPAFDEFYGIEDVIDRIVSFCKHAAQGLEEHKQILYLLGPVGSSKSSLAEKLKSLIQQVPVYVLADEKGNLSPVFDNPLNVFKYIDQAAQVCEHYNIPAHTIQSIPSPWAIERLKEYDGDVTKFKVVKIYPNALNQEWSWIPLVTDNANLMQTTKKNVHPLLDPYNRHIHVVFTLSNRHHLVFCDSRKFGTITVQKSETLYTVHLKHVGPEPLETNFTLQNFKERLLRSPLRAIKTVLMDQSIIAGIGNIYSDEMLHRSHILPTRTPKSLHETEWKLLFTSMKQVLNKGIDFGGDSTSDYRNIYGERGAFHANHLVYLRTKEKCLRKGCAGVIIKKPLNGRSSHFCPMCQK
jgi:DNA-formamidopyrimidine glycosylase